MTRVSWLSWLSSWVKVVRGLFSPGTSYHPDTEDTEDTEARGAVWAVTLVKEGSSTEYKCGLGQEEPSSPCLATNQILFKTERDQDQDIVYL